MYKEDLGFNNLLCLVCHQTKPIFCCQKISTYFILLNFESGNKKVILLHW